MRRCVYRCAGVCLVCIYKCVYPCKYPSGTHMHTILSTDILIYTHIHTLYNDTDIGGLDKQIQELIEAVVLPMTQAERFTAIGVYVSMCVGVCIMSVLGMAVPHSV